MPSTTTFPPVARSFLSDSSMGMTPIRRSLSTISWGSIPTLMLLQRARCLTRPQFDPSGGWWGHSLPYWVGGRSLASKFGWLLLSGDWQRRDWLSGLTEHVLPSIA